ncbi:MAG: DUF6468 domain-containing protein [Rhodospirillales bacterium]
MALSIALDLLVSGLLLVTICYAMVLNKKIGTLRRDKSELEKMAASFNTATMKADKSLKKLKITASELGEQVEIAHSLRDDLMFLTERGSSAADKLEDLVRAARDKTKPAARKPVATKPRTGKIDTSDFAVPDYNVTDFPKQKAPDGLGPMKASAAEKRRELAASRSEAERELIRALQLAR